MNRNVLEIIDALTAHQDSDSIRCYIKISKRLFAMILRKECQIAFGCR